MRMARKRRHLAFEVYPQDPVLVNPLGIERYGALSGETWGGNRIWAVMDWVIFVIGRLYLLSRMS